MKKVLIVYGSTTGNTEYMAEIISKGFINAGIKTGLANVTDFDPLELDEDLNALILGCPAYGHDSVEFQEDFEEFFEGIEDLNLKGRKFAVFAPGDSSYEYFCGTVDEIEEVLEKMGAEKLIDGLKVDGDPEDYEEEIREWAESIACGL